MGRDWLAAQKVDMKKYDAALHSFTVASKLRRASQMRARTSSTEFPQSSCRDVTWSSRALRSKRCWPPPIPSSAKPASSSPSQALAARDDAPCAGLLAAALALLALDVPAQIEAGREYQRIEPPARRCRGRPGGGDRVLLLRLPGVLPAEPQFARWIAGAPDYVAVRRVPALSSEAWEPLAKLYYTLEALGQVERLHWPVYDTSISKT